MGFIEKNKALCILLFLVKSEYRSLVLCRPSPGLQSFTIRIPGANAPGYYATAPMRGLRIRLAALAVFGRRNGCRRGEECPLGMVKNLPAADGEEQLAL